MSIRIMSRVFDLCNLGPVHRLILLALADHADDSGRCYPSIDRLAKRTGLTERAVRGNLRQLEAGGYIDTKIGAGPQGCNVYFVRVDPERNAPRNEMPPGTKCPEGGNLVPQRGEPRAPKPSKTIIEPSENTPLPPKGEGFEEFWSIVPKKVGKGAAEKAWAKATKDTDPETIIDGMRRYASERQGKDQQYTAHPATWLNAKRWTDEAAPTARSFHDMISQALETQTDAISGPRQDHHQAPQRLPAPLQDAGPSGPGGSGDRNPRHGRGDERAYAHVIRPRRFGGADF